MSEVKTNDEIHELHMRAEQYLHGCGVKIDEKVAAELLHQALNKGSTHAAFKLGKLYYGGKGVPKNLPLAMELFRKAAKSGDRAAFRMLYQILNPSICGSFKHSDDREKLIYDLLNEFLVREDSWCLLTLGELYEGNHDTRDIKKSREFYRLAEENADAETLLDLAGKYFSGSKSIDKNAKHAHKLCEKSADLGNVCAQHMLADLYDNGNQSPEAGVTVLSDPKQSLIWRRRAQQQGWEECLGLLQRYKCKKLSQSEERIFLKILQEAVRNESSAAHYCLGILYLEGGCGLSIDQKVAFELFQQAWRTAYKYEISNIQLGNLATFFEIGYHQDKALSFKLHQLAAEEEDAFYNYDLGEIYLSERLVPKDINQAKRCFQKAIDYVLKNYIGKTYFTDMQTDYGSILYKIAELYEEGNKFEKDEKMAAEIYQMACQLQNFKAHYKLALLYAEGRGVTQNRKLATEYMLKVVMLDYRNIATGCSYDHSLLYSIAQMFEYGDKIEKNIKQAIEIYRLLAEQLDLWVGHQAQYKLACLYLEGVHVTQNTPLAIEYAQRSWKAGNTCYLCSVAAKYLLGRIYLEGLGVPKDEVQAVKHFEAIGNIDANACFKLGHIFETSKTLLQDNKRAFEWYERAVSKNCQDAYLPLSRICLEGRGVSIDANRKLFQKLNQLCSTSKLDENTQSRNLEEELQLAKNLADGNGVEQDKKKAYELLMKIEKEATLLRDKEIIFKLAQEYEQGKIMTQDLKHSFNLYYLAACYGQATAQFKVAQIYGYHENGKPYDVSEDFELAVDWYRFAAENEFVWNDKVPALHWATELSLSTCLPVLFEKGVELNDHRMQFSSKAIGHTVLTYAMLERKLQFIKMLLACNQKYKDSTKCYGLDLNYHSPDGTTALHLAAEFEELHVFIPSLLKQGANEAYVKQGLTAVELAANRNKMKSLVMFRHHSRLPCLQESYLKRAALAIENPYVEKTQDHFLNEFNLKVLEDKSSAEYKTLFASFEALLEQSGKEIAEIEKLLKITPFKVKELLAQMFFDQIKILQLSPRHPEFLYEPYINVMLCKDRYGQDILVDALSSPLFKLILEYYKEDACKEEDSLHGPRMNYLLTCFESERIKAKYPLSPAIRGFVSQNK